MAVGPVALGRIGAAGLGLGFAAAVPTAMALGGGLGDVLNGNHKAEDAAPHLLATAGIMASGLSVVSGAHLLRHASYVGLGGTPARASHLASTRAFGIVSGVAALALLGTSIVASATR